MSGVTLVTGGAGFIGSHVVDDLVAHGCPVRCLDLLDPGVHAAPPPYLNPHAELVRGDIRDSDVVARCLEGVDAVCHQAAKVGLGVDLLDIGDYVSHNDLGTAVLLGEMARAGFRGRLVLASSMVVYGEGSYRCPRHGEVVAAARTRADLESGRFEPGCPRCGRALEAQAVTEDAPADPRNVYAATKLAQEHLCGALARETDGVALTVLRYHNVYGSRMPRDTPYAGVASIFRSALEAGRAPRVFEDGAQMRDFVHVSDVAAANVLALTAAEVVPGTFNVASGRPASVGAMARALVRAANGTGEAGEAPEPVVTGAFRLGDVRHVFASIERARRELGFAPRVGLDEGMTEFATAPLREPAPAS